MRKNKEQEHGSHDQLIGCLLLYSYYEVAYVIVEDVTEGKICYQAPCIALQHLVVSVNAIVDSTCTNYQH